MAGSSCARRRTFTGIPGEYPSETALSHSASSSVPDSERASSFDRRASGNRGHPLAHLWTWLAELTNFNSWLNHACAPNCETIEDDDRIFIHTLRPIEPGEELFIEYLLALDDPSDEEARLQYACRCAAANCRQSMLADAA
ncbi:SET domain-containing protein [Paraburkholderia sp. GAS334]|uniref:SET domain-containing protein n=1 Tax=Paraburkholderia sp. GAS334 TaxID=3035131 RepID=UPI003D1C2EEE